MKSTEHIRRRTGGIQSFMKWPLLCGLLALPGLLEIHAADAVYQNDGIVNYPLYQSTPPDIDATNFINNNTFVINFTAFSFPAYSIYETSDTKYYTNNGLMVANSGFLFDNRSSVSSSRTWSANFYNQGTISCGSVDNVEDPYSGLLYLFGVYPQCFVAATNIANPGNITVGQEGRIQLAGKYVDLTRTTLKIEGSGAEAGVTGSGVGTSGLNTNFWSPGFELTATTASSPLIPLGLFNFTVLNLTNSMAYIETNSSASNYTVIRAVFIQDESLENVAYNVYLGNSGLIGGDGTATVEWIGTYLDPASGNTISNYLYLNNNYIRSTSTNLFLFNGVPDNFTFTSSDVPIDPGFAPTAEGFLDLFPLTQVTNRYSYTAVQLISSSVDTNIIPNHSITNLPGRVEISADSNLNLANAVISGMNYMSIQSSNQFEGSQGATIKTPYADINVGVTNGFLTVSNLISASIPNWSGNVQAWSTRWLEEANGVTNDYRVLIVQSKLSPQSSAAIQDLVLHGTNSIVISDTFNIMRTFTADAKNLTLTTNGLGTGATSFAGELNVGSPNIFWASALPNLRNLTNDGAIRLQNLAQFIGTSNSLVGIPSAPAMAATGLLSQVTGRTNVQVNNSVTVGTNQYVFVTSLTPSSPANRVKIAPSFDGTLSNLIAAINRSSGAGSAYSTSTKSNSFVLASKLTNHAFMVTARVAGTTGNSIVTTNSASTTNLTWNGFATLHGGAAAVVGSTNLVGGSVAYNNLVNRGLISAMGTSINADYFENTGMCTNGVFSAFSLLSKQSVISSGSIYAGADISLSAENLLASNSIINAGRSLALVLTTNGLLTDGGIYSSNFWSVGGAAGVGLSLPVKPAWGDLLGTTITNIAPTNKVVKNTWAARDFGVSLAGYTNNQALGRLILNVYGAAPQNGQFYFTGAGTSNALYVDYLELQNQATNFNNGSVPSLQINTNLIIYYAQAVANGVSVADKLNGLNAGRLRWVSNYVGNFSYTSIVYPDGTTNLFNAALAASSTVDSDGDGIYNFNDPTPFFLDSQLNFVLSVVSNNPALKLNFTWNSIPGATSYVQFSTNLPPLWKTILTNVSPATVPPPGGWPITNSVQYTPAQTPSGFYRLWMNPVQ